MKLTIGQVWISKTHPHESFKIYDGKLVDSEVNFKNKIEEFNKLPESSKIYLWERTDFKSYLDYSEKSMGDKLTGTLPYAWASECKRETLMRKIRKFNMQLGEVVDNHPWSIDE